MCAKFILGLIVNPISGMGGTVGLKGTDGKEILKNAIKLGAKPNAHNRTREFLSNLKSIKPKINFITCPKYMGEYVLNDFDFEFQVLEDAIFEDYDNIYDTNADHTKKAAKIFLKKKSCNLLIFVGGDGTARDIQKVVDLALPCLGIPSGVKVYSSVFSLDPRNGANLIIRYINGEIPLKEKEVVDINEKKFRKGDLESKLYGYLKVPFYPDYSQYSKMSTPDSDLDNQDRIAKKIVEDLQDDIIYILGPGSTVKKICERLDEDGSLLGVDILKNKKIIAKDVNERGILEVIKKNEFKIILSPIGRQGFVLGRGNLQISPKILKKLNSEDLIIISTKFKINNIPKQTLRIDTRNPKLDDKFKGLYKVITDYEEVKICEVK